MCAAVTSIWLHTTQLIVVPCYYLATVAREPSAMTGTKLHTYIHPCLPTALLARGAIAEQEKTAPMWWHLPSREKSLEATQVFASLSSLAAEDVAHLACHCRTTTRVQLLITREQPLCGQHVKREDENLCPGGPVTY
eukprot:COSAG01_NODE_2603_length_7393_cov_39.196874_1_plen_137_part_00